MKKAVVASLLAFSVATGIGTGAHVAFAQTAVNLGSQASGDVQMPPAEYADYTAAMGQTDPKAKAAAIEAYLTKYPQSQVKAAALQALMQAYSGIDPTKTLDAADRLLQVDPNNLVALTFEVYFRKGGADTITDPSAKQTALDSAASYAQKGFAVTKPKDMSDADFAKMKATATPVFYSAIGTAALNKKDAATAIDNFKKELASVPEDQTKVPGPILQDTYTLGSAYYQSTPPDFLNCAFYAARAANFAPEPYKTQMMPLAKFCYKRYHGKDDGFDAVMTAAAGSLNPPAGFSASIKPAPKPSDLVHDLVTTTPEADLPKLAMSDREFALANGSAEDAGKIWDTVKGKSSQFPDATVIAATDSSVQVAVSDDAVQSKAADFTFNMTAPLKTVPEVGSKITLTGTYASFTPSPLMIVMSDGEVVEPKKAPVKKPAAPVHHTAPAKK
jgi:hypothetical protein